MSPSGSRTQISGISPSGSAFCRRASRSRLAGSNTDRAVNSFPARIGGSTDRARLVLMPVLSGMPVERVKPPPQSLVPADPAIAIRMIDPIFPILSQRHELVGLGVSAAKAR